MKRKLVSTLLAAAALGAAFVALPPAGASGDGHHVMIGAYPGYTGSLHGARAVVRLERLIGRRLSIVRVYDRWNSRFPSPYERWIKRSHHMLYVSVQSTLLNGKVVRWREIADAKPGSRIHRRIVRWANRIRRYRAHVLFTFQHEPESVTNRNKGSRFDFRRAWRRIVDVFRSRGANNAEFVWVLSDYSFKHASAVAGRWYPGNRYVDDIGADSYNWAGCRGHFSYDRWRPFRRLLRPLKRFGRHHARKGLIVAEWASQEGSPGKKAAWIMHARDTLATDAWRQFKAVIWFNEAVPYYPRCRWPVDSSSSSLSAFSSASNDSLFFGG
jgi:hypothetical protein